MDYYIDEGVAIPLTVLTMPLFVTVSSYNHRHISWYFCVQLFKFVLLILVELLLIAF